LIEEKFVGKTKFIERSIPLVVQILEANVSDQFRD